VGGLVDGGVVGLDEPVDGPRRRTAGVLGGDEGQEPQGGLEGQPLGPFVLELAGGDFLIAMVSSSRRRCAWRLRSGLYGQP